MGWSCSIIIAVIYQLLIGVAPWVWSNRQGRRRRPTNDVQSKGSATTILGPMFMTSFSSDLNLEIICTFHIHKPRIKRNFDSVSIIWKCEARMRGGSIGLIDFVSCNRTQALRICKNAYGEIMLSSINIVRLGETAQGWWTTYSGRRSTTGCNWPIHIWTRKDITTWISRSNPPSIAICLHFRRQKIHRCARLWTRAIEVNVRLTITIVIIITTRWYVYLVNWITNRPTIGGGTVWVCKCVRVGFITGVLDKIWGPGSGQRRTFSHTADSWWASNIEIEIIWSTSHIVVIAVPTIGVRAGLCISVKPHEDINLVFLF